MEVKQKKIPAETMRGRYDIYVGESILPRLIANGAVCEADHRACIISRRVYGLHRDYIDESLKKLPDYHLLLMNDSEKNKNYRYAEEFLEAFLENGMNRHSIVIAIGGGVVGDFAGYCAALYMRGIPIVHAPTTLLSMVDSSIGGKTAVNLSRGKNIAGAFHQPLSVISDIRFLRTLPDNELKNGLVEALKHGLIGDSGTRTLFEENNFNTIKESRVISSLIALSASFKSQIVKEDETEKGRRAILNFGHTVGHAIESIMGYEGISHGEAVAAGIRVMLKVSAQMGYLSDDEIISLNNLMDRYQLIPGRFPLKGEDLAEHMGYDKKNRHGTINFVMLEKPASPRINTVVPLDILIRAMRETILQ